MESITKNGDLLNKVFKVMISFAIIITLLHPIAENLDRANAANPESDFTFVENRAIPGTISITKYVGTTKDVVIPEFLGGSPVTDIASNAFKSLSITSVDLPAQLVTIGNYAFQTNSITEVVLPSGVTTVGLFAFASNKINKLTLNEGLQSIGNSAFLGLANGTGNKVKTLVIPSTVTSIGQNTFQYLSIENLEIKGSGTIGNYAFDSNLITGTLVIPEGTTTIGANAFDRTNQITGLVLPNSLQTISTSAFNKNNITKVEIPEGVTQISASAFALNPNLVEVRLPVSITSIGSGAFKPTSVANSVSQVTIYGYDGNTTLATYLANSANSAHPYISLTDYATIGTPNDESDFRTTINSGKVTITGYKRIRGNVVIPDTIGGLPVTEIGDNAFLNAKLRSVKIPDTVVRIMPQSFEGNNLTEITFPKSLNAIASGAFRGNQLTEIEVPFGVTSIVNMAFENNKISKAIIPPTVTAIGSSAFNGNQLIASNLEIHGYENPTVARVFADSKGYTFVSLGGTYIPPVEDPFTDYTYTKTTTEVTITGYTGMAKSLNIPSEIEGLPVTTIGLRAFQSKGLIGVKIPNSVTTIMQDAFRSNKLVNVDLPTGLTKIGANAFMTNSLVSLVIPNSVEEIESGAFSANALTSVSIGNNLGYITNLVFANNKLTEVEIPSSVYFISKTAFQNNQATPANLKLKSNDSNPLTKNYSSNMKFSYESTGTGSLMFSGLLDKHTGMKSKIATSSKHSAVVDSKGDLYTWGGSNWLNDKSGEALGLGDNMYQLSPVKVPTLSNIVAVETAEYRTVALDSNGDLYSFGTKFLGLGSVDSTAVPIKVSGISDVVAISSTYRHTLAITSNGDVYSWGNNNNGKLGLGDTVDRTTPEKISGISNAVGISAGVNHSMVVTASGEVYTFGYNYDGQLGIGTTADSLVPVLVPNLTGVEIFEIAESNSLGQGSTTMVTKDGSVYFMGHTGKLGSSSYRYNQMQTTPKRISGVRNVKALVANNYRESLVFVTEDNRLINYSWSEGTDTETGQSDILVQRGPYDVDDNVNETLEVRYNVFIQYEPSGEICLWGDRSTGAIGDGKKTTSLNTAYSKDRSCITTLDMGPYNPNPPVVPPTDPNNPTVPPTTPTTPPTSGGDGVEIIIGSGDLKMKVPTVNRFSNATIPKDNVRFNTNFIDDLEVYDSRGTGDGWRVSLTATEFQADINGSIYYLPAGRLSMKKPSTISNKDTGDSTGLKNEITPSTILIDGTGPITVATANVGYGKGTTVIDFNNIDTLELSLFAHELLVDSLTKEANYVSTLTWTITDAP